MINPLVQWYCSLLMRAFVYSFLNYFNIVWTRIWCSVCEGVVLNPSLLPTIYIWFRLSLIQPFSLLSDAMCAVQQSPCIYSAKLMLSLTLNWHLVMSIISFHSPFIVLCSVASIALMCMRSSPVLSCLPQRLNQTSAATQVCVLPYYSHNQVPLFSEDFNVIQPVILAATL